MEGGERFGRLGVAQEGRDAYVVIERLAEEVHWDLLVGRDRSSALQTALSGAISVLFTLESDL